jgi:membrane protein YqaA with SNARE-associated domain
MGLNIESLGLVGVFLGGAIPWLEAIAVVTAGMLLGLNPVWIVVAAVSGNTITIFVFAWLGHRIRAWLVRRREVKGLSGEHARFEKAQRVFDKYGIYGLAVLGPLIIGTQFAAAIAVAAGVRPLKASILISFATLLFAIGTAWVMSFIMT